MTDTATDLTFEELVKDQESPTCENDHCVADHMLPGTWFMSHKDAEPKCSRIICEPCALSLQGVLAEASKMRGFLKSVLNEDVVSMTCGICMVQFEIEEAVIRKI